MNINVYLDGKRVEYNASFEMNGDLKISINSIVPKPEQVITLSDDELDKKLIKFFVYDNEALSGWFEGCVELRQRYDEEVKDIKCGKCKGDTMRKYLTILRNLYKEGQINVPA